MAISTLSPALAPTVQPTVTNRKPLQPGEDIPETVTFDLPSSENLTTDDVAYALPTSKAPTLQRPVLLVHGYNSGPATWKNMDGWLTDGGNKEGGVVQAGSTNVNGQGKVFEIQFSRPYNSVKTNAAELKQVIDKITAATGSSQIDVVGHSMGGLDAREYLDEGGSKIKNLVMIATPNRGSELGDIELGFRKLGVPIAPSVDDPEVRQCVQDLTVDTVENGKPNNPTVHALNANWERQRERANIYLIAGNGTTTLETPTHITARGDGVVPRSSVTLDKVPEKNIWWTTHTSIHTSPEALVATADFLTGHSVDTRDTDPSGVAPDRDIVPVKVTADANQVQYIIQDKKA